MSGEGGCEYEGGLARLEVELEFIASLGDPSYLHAMALSGQLEQEGMLGYLAALRESYLRPELARLVLYPSGLEALRLLAHKPFREKLKDPHFAAALSAAVWVAWDAKGTKKESREAAKEE